MDLDSEVKLKIYEMTAQHASVPNSTEIAVEMGILQILIEKAFERLYAERLLVPDPGDLSKIIIFWNHHLVD